MDKKNQLYFGKNIKYLIRKRNFRQFEFAEKINSKQGTISNWINGLSFPNFDMLLILADALNVSLDSLVYSDLENSNNLIKSNELNEPQELYKRTENTEGGIEYEVVKIYEPEIVKVGTDTEGGLLESLIKRVEVLEKEIRNLKMNK